MEEGHDGAKLLSSFSRRAASLFRADNVTSGGFETETSPGYSQMRRLSRNMDAMSR